MAVVIYHEEDGVFLGQFQGLGFWSKIDPGAQSEAVTFPDAAAAEEFMATWDCGRPDGVRLVPVEESSRGAASIANCVKAGLPGWIDEYIETANSLPV